MTPAKKKSTPPQLGITQSELEARIAEFQAKLQVMAAAVSGTARVTRYRVKGHWVKRHFVPEHEAIRITLPKAKKK